MRFRAFRVVLSIPLVVLVAAFTLAPAPALSQQGKSPLTHDAYDSWRSIAGEALSNDGNWLLYVDLPQDGDAELVVQRIPGSGGSQPGTAGEYRQSIGWLTPPGMPRAQPQAAFTYDSRYVAFLASPSKEAVRAAKKDEAKPDEMPTKSLGILDLADGSLVQVERVKSFSLPEEAGGWAAYLMEKPLSEKKDDESEKSGAMPVAEGAEKQSGEDKADDKKKKKDYGTELVIRDLTEGRETRVDSVLTHQFTDDGARLVYTVSSKEEPALDGVYAFDTANTGAVHALANGEGNYKRLALNRDQTRLAFVTDRADYESDEPVFELYGTPIDGREAQLWMSHASTAGFPDGYAVSDKSEVSFSDEGSVVLFGIKQRPVPDADSSDDKDPLTEDVEMDLWHWNDPYPQPRQLNIAQQMRDQTYESVFHIDERLFVQLADEDLLDVSLSHNGAVGFGTTDKAHAKRGSYEGTYVDAYVVDVRTGDRTLVAQQLPFGATLSPEGKYVAWYGGDGHWVGYDHEGGGGFEGGEDWFVHDVRSGETRNITESLDASFARHDWDTPNVARSYGSAGFTTGDEALLIYDRFDIWAVPTDSSSSSGGPWRITEGVAREANMSLRYMPTDPDARAIDSSQPILLMGTHQDTMATAFYTDNLAGNAPPIELLGVEARLTFRDVSDNSNRVLFSRQTFSEYPDLWVASYQMGEDGNAGTVGDRDQAGGPNGVNGHSGGGTIAPDPAISLTDVRKLTDLGSQTTPYIWGNAELREFRSSDGLPLKGILITPEDFDPDKQYPMMVYIYETLHQGLHNFRHPSPGTSVNLSYYVSNGYVLWMPDIEYSTGYPGKDALKCVLPGINMLVDEGYIDDANIGIQGHSWGGYQIAYMVTQTNIFKAAEAGAPVSNMTSAYGGIRWASGLVRQFQYERTQSRLGGSLWETPLRYIENSPLFWADKINTPLLMIHNDADGAVPWYQGIELMMALRRLEKEAYMLNYNGEAHGLRQRHNQIDWTVRMQQFFDHHLRDAPPPGWMTDGIKGWEKPETEE